LGDRKNRTVFYVNSFGKNAKEMQVRLTMLARPLGKLKRA